MPLTETCGIIFDRKDDIDDVSGCLKLIAHNDHHVCENKNGELIAWQDDYKCTCGCWEEEGRPCVIYWKVNSITD